MNTEGWVGTKEAESITGVSRTTLYILRLTGKIAVTKVGQTVLYSLADCQRIAQERKDSEGGKDG